jgi:hypothetical protein
VKLDSSGTLQKDVGTDTATPVGVFLGCSYTDPTFGKTFRQYYASTTNITDIVAYVQDDPDALFKVAVVSTGSTISYVNRTAVGNNGVLIQTAGSTITGNSKVCVSSTTATTATFPVRIIDVIAETQSAAGSYTEVVVKWNAPSSNSVGGHQYLLATGT